MAHLTDHRRTVATSEHPKNTSNTTLNPTNKSKLTTKTKNPDPVLPSKAFYLPSTFSRLYTSHNNGRTTTSQKPSNTANRSNVTNNGNARDNLMQAKVLNVSADFDSSKLQSLIKRNQPKISHGSEKVRNKSSSDLVEVKMKKSSSYKEVVKEKKESYKDGVDFEGLDKGNPVSLAVSGRRRRSFGGVQIELSDVFASNGVKVVSVDMAPFMQTHAVDCARKTLDSLEKFSCKTLALTLKKEFDGVYGPAWHCIVGTSFGSFVTHSVGGFMYFSMDQKTYVLLFKTTVQRAD